MPHTAIDVFVVPHHHKRRHGMICFWFPARVQTILLYVDDDFLTPWDELPTDMEKAASITHPEQRHSRQQVQEQLPTLSYMKGLGDQPQVALAQAKQQFTQWLSGAHAHPDYSEHIEQQKAQHRQAVTGFVYTEDSNGIKYKVAADEAGQLKHASLGV